MPTKNAQVVALAQKIAKLMHSEANRTDALDAHVMASLFYRRLSSPSCLRTSVDRQSKRLVPPVSL
jgi:hypothetical protein